MGKSNGELITKVIIDNGHGKNTFGKRSPDEELREYAWTRDVARRVQLLLRGRGIDSELLVPGDDDVPLWERVDRANEICRRVGDAKRCLLISLHVNAAGLVGWHNANGWSVFVSRNASVCSRQFAELLSEKAVGHGLKLRRQYPDVGYWEQSLAIVRDTYCPAVLSENLFMDNKEDCRWLLTEEGKDTIAAVHADAVSDFIAAA